MKFLTLSLIGLGFIAQSGEASAGFDLYLNDLFESQHSSDPSHNVNQNQGYQNLINSFDLGIEESGGFFGKKSSSPSNLQSEWTKPNFDNEKDWDKFAQRYPKNPLSHIDDSKWGIFDHNKRFCTYPRYWNGNRCVCHNNGCFISGKCYDQLPPLPPLGNGKANLEGLKLINRNFDGTENNINNPTWGSKLSDLERLCDANYYDGKSQMWHQKPNPRTVSNFLGEIQGKIKESRLGLNMLYPIWGQFVDHDITLTPEGHDEKQNIPIDMCDEFMDPECKGDESFPFSRSVYSPNHQVRTHINVITAWLDGSNIYGSDKATADNLREFSKGKMKTSDGNMLPKNSKGQYQSGDVRVNENIALTSFHTLFVRQHNRICDIVSQKNPNLTDQEVFQIARNYVAGLIQHITYDEWLPALLGKQKFDSLIGDYTYDKNANPNIITEFSAAAFRLGHTLINSPFKLMDNYGRVLDQLELGQMFFNPSILNNQTINQIFNGLSKTHMKERSIEVVHQLRNFLFLTPGHTVKIDLYSFNLQRGRDHGICGLNTAREKLGLPKKDFKDLFENQQKAEDLKILYQKPDNVDLWLGVIGQKAQYGAVLGELGSKLTALQFKNIRNGDRLWYENVYPSDVIKEIKSTTLADIIKRNTNVQYLNDFAFRKW